MRRYAVQVKGGRAIGGRRWYVFRSGLTNDEADELVARLQQAGHEARTVEVQR